MHSRAYLLLRRDLVNLQRFPLEGVSAGPSSEGDLFRWEARLHGLAGTEWEGGVFHLQLRFNAEFNSSPPAVQFMSIPFHPNIDPTEGTPCCHLLTIGWSEEASVSTLLLSLQSLLSTPELDSCCVLNPVAAQLLREVPRTYHQMARDCVTASIRVNAGLAPYEEEEESALKQISPTPSLPSPRPTGKKMPHPISFDDYHSLWRNLATSRPISLHHPPATSRADLQHRLQQHRVLQYGQNGSRQKKRESTADRSKARLRRMERLKQMYLVRGEEKGERSGSGGEEGGEKEEVDKLVQWTTHLSDGELST